MKIQLAQRPAPLWLRALLPLAAVVVTFLLTAGFVLAVGADPLEASYYFLLDPLSNRVRAIEVLVKATPLLLTGAAVALAFAGGYWNIGAEGQLYLGRRRPRPSACKCTTGRPGWPCRSSSAAAFWPACCGRCCRP